MDNEKDSLVSLVFIALFSFFCFILAAFIFLLSVFKNEEITELFMLIPPIVFMSFAAIPLFMTEFIRDLFKIIDLKKELKQKESIINGDI